MKINGKSFHTIWLHESDDTCVCIIDQRSLPHQFLVEELRDSDDVFIAIREMHVRGAPLIGVTAAYGMYFIAIEALQQDDPFTYIQEKADYIKQARPTAVNLSWAIERQLNILPTAPEDAPAILLQQAEAIKKESIDRCHRIGQFGLTMIQELFEAKKEAINILTHCNAGWLACVDYGTATAAIYLAHDAGIPVHVWVDETRPRNQGARLTAFELKEHGIPHTIIVDNAGGHLMQHGQVDVVIVGTDRTTRSGDVCNKIGTYLKALAAYDNQIPFYVAAPTSSIDTSIQDGLKEIPIELRSEKEVKYIQGATNGEIQSVLLTPKESPAANYAFDVTPSRLVTGIITEVGVWEPNQEPIESLLDPHTS